MDLRIEHVIARSLNATGGDESHVEVGVRDLLDGSTHELSAGVPTVWLGMIDHIERTGESLGDLKVVTIGGSAAPRAMIQWFRDRGVNATFVGHPLFDEPRERMNVASGEHHPVVGIVPGSDPARAAQAAAAADSAAAATPELVTSAPHTAPVKRPAALPPRTKVEVRVGRTRQRDDNSRRNGDASGDLHWVGV